MTDAPPAPGSGPHDDDDVVEGELLEADADAGEPTEAPAAELSVETLVTDLERVTAERDQFRDAYQRTAADFDNLRKTAQRRVDDEVQRASAGLVERLLPVLDACDGALAHGATEVEPIAGALLAALEKEGLVRIHPLGEAFDPTVADAVVHEPGDGGDHVVAEVMRAGYTWQGRVLRPAMVKVTD
jgi:molecular chaperone GrpE